MIEIKDEFVTEKTELKQELGLFSAMTIVMGSMIGSGVFIVTADVARGLGNREYTLLAWIFASVMTVMGAASYSRLAAAYPHSGGQYVFIREAWGKLLAFLYGWAMIFVIQGGFLAAVGTAFAKFAGVIWPIISNHNTLFWLPFGFEITTAKLLAISSILLLSAFNVRGVKEGAILQNVFTTLKVLAVLAVIFLGFAATTLFHYSPPLITKSLTHYPVADIKQLWWLLPTFAVGPLFSSDAWNNVTFIGGEIKNPERIIPKALILGTVSVCLIYIITNLAYFSVLPLVWIQNAPEDRVATLVLEQLFGPTGALMMAGAILISTFGCLNGMIMAGARVIYAMAKDGLFFKQFEALDPKFLTPKKALIAQGLWASFLALTGTYLALLDYIVFTALIFYVVTVLGSYQLAKAGKIVLPTFWSRVLPFAYSILITYVALILAFTKPSNTLPGLLLVLLGIPIYAVWKKYYEDKKLQPLENSRL